MSTCSKDIAYYAAQSGSNFNNNYTFKSVVEKLECEHSRE